jgi:formate hydrogenlyase subunit 3/multisubunit Na+/H+ antiporter MnhD subunit
MKLISRLWIAVAFLAALSPLGIIVARYFKSGPAWGEWEIFPKSWKAPLPAYLESSWFGYMFSAIIGIIAVAALIFLFGKLLVKNDEK